MNIIKNMHRFFKKFQEYFENAIITKTFSASYLDLTHLKLMCDVL